MLAVLIILLAILVGLLCGVVVTFVLRHVVRRRKRMRNAHKAEREHRVVFTLSTLPSRADRVHETVKDLLDSTVHPDAVYVNVPFYCERLKEKYKVPDNLVELAAKSEGRVIINRCEDSGPATKLLPVLREETDADTIIFTADDDVHYPRDYHEELLEASEANPERAYGYRGLNFRNNGAPRYVASETGPVDAIEGFTGACYRRGFFDANSVEQVPKTECWFTDDIWISSHLSSRGVDRILLEGEPHNVGMGRKGKPVRQRKTLSATDPLHLENHRKRNRACYQQLRHHFRPAKHAR